LYFLAIAAWLILAPQAFYAAIPGVMASGPLNVHLLRDVGIAYAVLSMGCAYALADSAAARFATAFAAIYLCGHAALHAFMESSNRNQHLTLAEAPGVYAPALLATAVALRFGRGRPAPNL
jgi:hypothetical protein